MSDGVDGADGSVEAHAVEEVLGHLTQKQTQIYWNTLLCDLTIMQTQNKVSPEDLLGGNVFVLALCAAPLLLSNTHTDS